MTLFENLVPLMQFDFIEARESLGITLNWEDTDLSNLTMIGKNK